MKKGRIKMKAGNLDRQWGKMLKSPIRLSTAVLVAIGLFDLVTTLMLMRMGVREGNPIFSALAGYGSLAFAAGKVVMLGGPILLLEYVRTIRPRSAEQGTWIAVIAYGGLYGYHLLTMVAHH